jgi:hypothetical protein
VGTGVFAEYGQIEGLAGLQSAAVDEQIAPPESHFGSTGEHAV